MRMGGIWCLKSSLKEKKICIYTHTYIITLKGKSTLYLIAIYFLKTSCKKFHSVPIAIYSKEYNNIVHFLKVCLGPSYVGKLYFSDFFSLILQQRLAPTLHTFLMLSKYLCQSFACYLWPAFSLKDSKKIMVFVCLLLLTLIEEELLQLTALSAQAFGG